MLPKFMVRPQAVDLWGLLLNIVTRTYMYTHALMHIFMHSHSHTHTYTLMHRHSHIHPHMLCTQVALEPCKACVQNRRQHQGTLSWNASLRVGSLMLPLKGLSHCCLFSGKRVKRNLPASTCLSGKGLASRSGCLEAVSFHGHTSDTPTFP